MAERPEVIVDLLQIHGLLFGLYGGEPEGPAAWLSSPNTAFNNESPLLHMLRNRQGIRDVLEYLRSMGAP